MKNKTNKKLSIALLDLDDIKNPLLGGGQAKTTYELGKILNQRGHEVVVYCSKYPGYKDRLDNGIYYKHVGFYTNNIKLNNLLYVITAPFYARKIKEDLIIECFTAPVSTLLSPLFTKVPVIGLGTSFEADRFSKLYHFPFWIVEKYGAKFYKYFIAYNPSHEKKMRSLNKKIIARTIPEGVEDSFLQLKRKKSKHILFLGRFDMNQKGIDLLLRAYAEKKAEINYPLIIVGVGPDNKKIKKMIKDLNLEKYVRLQGPEYGEEKMKLLSEALFVAIPSRSESFSLFTLEAIASGSPVVIFDIPGLSWVGKNVSLRAKPFDVNSYSENLLQMTDESIVRKMSINAKEFAKQFTWEKVVDEFENFFDEVVEKERILN